VGKRVVADRIDNLDKFAWVGSFSRGIPEEFDKDFPKLDAKANSQVESIVDCVRGSMTG